MRRTLRLLGLAVSVAIMASPQAPEAQSNPIGDLALPISGAPLSLLAHGRTESTLSDGTVRTLVSEGKIYRDAAGRTRSESILLPGMPEQALLLTSLTDPVAGLRFILIPRIQTAYRVTVPQAEPPQRPRFAFLGAGSELIRETGEKNRTHATLGQQTIEGIEFEGTRTTTTVVHQPSKVAVDEYWICPGLGLIGLIRNSSPRGRTTVTIQNLVRQEPDPSLFVVPPGYRIADFAELLPPE